MRKKYLKNDENKNNIYYLDKYKNNNKILYLDKYKNNNKTLYLVTMIKFKKYSFSKYK